jgi:nitroreductase
MECIDLANHAPMGGNLERNRWMIIDDPDTKAKISEYFGAAGDAPRPLLAVGYYTGDTFTPAPRRPAADVTYLNRWKHPVE